MPYKFDRTHRLKTHLTDTDGLGWCLKIFAPSGAVIAVTDKPEEAQRIVDALNAHPSYRL